MAIYGITDNPIVANLLFYYNFIKCAPRYYIKWNNHEMKCSSKYTQKNKVGGIFLDESFMFYRAGRWGIPSESMSIFWHTS